MNMLGIAAIETATKNYKSTAENQIFNLNFNFKIDLRAKN